MSSSSVQNFPEQEANVEGETNPELYEHFANLVSSLPSTKSMGDNKFYRLDCIMVPMVGAMVADACFNSRISDIIIATQPKAGTTWMKSLLYATVHRSKHPVDDGAGGHPLNSWGPHELIKYLEYQIYTNDKVPDLDKLPEPRLFATHVPFVSLPRSVVAMPCCKIVYVCRDPKDQLISMWGFANKLRLKDGLEPVPLEAVAELFYTGLSSFGSYWDHVLGYWHAHGANPDKVLFFRYEEMQRDPAAHVRSLAEFVGIPFSSEEEDRGVVDAIVALCSFERMRGVAATKSGRTELPFGAMPNSSFFWRGVVGDWVNHLSPEMARRIEAITEDKFRGSGLDV